jgi:hypothetical protein
VGKANGSRVCAPDDRLRVPTFKSMLWKVGTAQARLCPPYENPMDCFAASLAMMGWTAPDGINVPDW